MTARRAQNSTLRTASLILPMITSPSSLPSSVLNPFIAAITPAITSATSRMSATYSTVPCPRALAGLRHQRAHVAGESHQAIHRTTSSDDD